MKDRYIFSHPFVLYIALIWDTTNNRNEYISTEYQTNISESPNTDNYA